MHVLDMALIGGLEPAFRAGKFLYDPLDAVGAEAHGRRLALLRRRERERRSEATPSVSPVTRQFRGILASGFRINPVKMSCPTTVICT